MKRIPIVLVALLALAIALPVAADDTPPSPPAPAIKAQDDGLAQTVPAPSATPSTAAMPAAPTSPVVVGVEKISSGDTSWMLTSTALVLMMTI
ncbi:MAG TPA: hypothetical protein VGL90_09950, partial [Casimicrobiaceae bacterium]